jgi:hypothetical protein
LPYFKAFMTDKETGFSIVQTSETASQAVFEARQYPDPSKGFVSKFSYQPGSDGTQAIASISLTALSQGEPDRVVPLNVEYLVDALQGLRDEKTATGEICWDCFNHEFDPSVWPHPLIPFEGMVRTGQKFTGVFVDQNTLKPLIVVGNSQKSADGKAEQWSIAADFVPVSFQAQIQANMGPEAVFEYGWHTNPVQAGSVYSSE